MKTYLVTVHYRYVVDGQLEKDHETHEVKALNEEAAKETACLGYGSKYSIFKTECARVLTKETLYNLTNPN